MSSVYLNQFKQKFIMLYKVICVSPLIFCRRFNFDVDLSKKVSNVVWRTKCKPVIIKMKRDNKKTFKNEELPVLIFNNPALDFFKCNLHYYFSETGIKYFLSIIELFMPNQPQLCTNLISLFTEYRDFNGIFIPRPLNTESSDETVSEKAEQAWLKGNIVSSFNQFSTIYEEGDKVLKKKIIKKLQQLIFHSVEKNGMAIITNIIKVVKKFSIEKNEMSLLVTLWYALFTSSLFEDNCLSVTLLKDSCFKNYLESFIPYFGANFLRNNEIGVYQRLIEMTLQYDMDNNAGILLRLLFDYYYKAGYFQGCSAVYKCCIDLEIKLTKDQIYKYNILKKTDIKKKDMLFDICHPKDIIYKF